MLSHTKRKQSEDKSVTMHMGQQQERQSDANHSHLRFVSQLLLYLSVHLVEFRSRRAKCFPLGVQIFFTILCARNTLSSGSPNMSFLTYFYQTWHQKHDTRSSSRAFDCFCVTDVRCTCYKSVGFQTCSNRYPNQGGNYILLPSIFLGSALPPEESHITPRGLFTPSLGTVVIKIQGTNQANARCDDWLVNSMNFDAPRCRFSKNLLQRFVETRRSQTKVHLYRLLMKCGHVLLLVDHSLLFVSQLLHLNLESVQFGLHGLVPAFQLFVAFLNLAGGRFEMPAQKKTDYVTNMNLQSIKLPGIAEFQAPEMNRGLLSPTR